MDRSAAYWFAIRARFRHEKQVDLFLKEKHNDSFLPPVKILRRRRDRGEFVNLPLSLVNLLAKIPLDNVSVNLYKGWHQLKFA